MTFDPSETRRRLAAAYEQRPEQHERRDRSNAEMWRQNHRLEDLLVLKHQDFDQFERVVTPHDLQNLGRYKRDKKLAELFGIDSGDAA